ncbi:unnamed protein product [Pseudo-nitzschia multistriata]|uniref:SH3 domain-containing protein n=1 Tax=Pseudo-nitzschia multistriata TaxID=183589 RepID=A0A448Z179_9STRA|nr:unnamed protein product [Pseudo-nitzschia multistriata]
MLSIDTSRDDGETEEDINQNKSESLSNEIKLKSPTYGMHLFPTEAHKQKQKQQLHVARTCSTTGSITSHEYSSHTRSCHSKNSGTTRGSCADSNNKIVVSSFSNLATQSIRQGKYQQALEYYQLALQDYRTESTKTTIVELVNAAATCFNLGALAKKLRDYSMAADYFTEAQDVYLRSRSIIESYVRSGGAGSLSTAASSASCSSASIYSCQVCLLQLIVETLHARAHLHYKYQSQIDDAVECHEEAVELLEDSNVKRDNSSNKQPRFPADHDIVFQRIHFSILPQELRWQLLVTSYQALGKFYMEKGELEDAIVAYKETLSVLRKLNDFKIESTVQRQEEILQILRALSDFYWKNHSESTDIVKLERVAYVQEDLECWEKAMQCWEHILHCQSKQHGNESYEVSVTLGQLARVMVLEGNLEGGLDLYQATADISLKNNKIKENSSNLKDAVFSIPEDVFASIMDLHNELDRIPDAINWLKSLLSKSERREDQARIQLELGKLYLHQGFIHAASDALYLSLELFDGEDASAFELLKKVKFLGERRDHGDTEGDSSERVDAAADLMDCRNTGVDCLKAITEDGESAFGSTLDPSKSVKENEAFDTSYDESEDLSKLMANVDYECGDDIDLQRINIDPNISGNSTLNCKNDLEEHLELIDDEKKEEEGPLKSLSTGAETLGYGIQYISDDVPLTSDEEPVSSFGGSPVKQTSVSTKSVATNELYSEKMDIADIYSSTSSPSNKIESIEPIQNGAETLEMHDTGPTTDSKVEAEENESSAEQGPRFRFQERPIITQTEASGFEDTPISTSNSADSRTALLNPAGKSVAAQTSIHLPLLMISPKNPIDDKVSRGKKCYAEISDKQSIRTGRSRLVKALSSPFRRSRSKSRSTTSNRLVPLDEEKEVRQSMPTRRSQNELDEESCNSKEAPISYIDIRGGPDDDRSLVSQLTFREYEMLSKKKEKQSENGHWWWGVSSEGLEGWFPSNYVNQAVEAAEGFLSAKAIHDRVKSRPLDFDSEDESELDELDEDDFSLLKDSFSKESKAQVATVDSGKKISITKPMEVPVKSRRHLLESSGQNEWNEVTNVGDIEPLCLESQIHQKKLQVECSRTQNGQEDISVAMLLFDLAKLYMQKRASADALLYSHQALRIQKSTLHLPEACKSLNLMAEVHCREQRYKDALSCYYEARRIQGSLYGYFHQEIARNLNNCGQVLARQGEFDLAMDKHKEALRIVKECCGENVKNPLVSDTLIQIGAVYYKERNSLANIQSQQNDGYKTFIEGGMLEVIGRAHEDRGSYRMAIAFFEEKLQFLNATENSDDLEDVAETLNSLGMLSCRAGMYLEAIDYYDRALGIQMKLGCDDVQLAMARVLAGSVQYSLGHFTKALKLFQDALSTLRQVGLEHETVAATLFHIGLVYAALCNYDEAMSNLRDALDIQSKLLGMEHPATFRTRREIGNLHAVYDSEIKSAFEEYNNIIVAQKRIHGEKHPYVAETLHSIGCAQARQGNLSDALRTLEDCYNMRLPFLGMDHPQQASTLHEIAKIQLKRGRLKKAIHIIDASLNIRVESLSDHHIDVALTMTTKASCLVAKGNFVDANKLFQEALPVAKTAVGCMHPSIAWIQVQIGVMNLRKCDFDRAMIAVKSAIEIYSNSNLDQDHPGIKEATDELERIERAEMLCV